MSFISSYFPTTERFFFFSVVKLTFNQFVGDLGLIFGAHPDLALVCQQGLLDRVEHQRVKETVLEKEKTLEDDCSLGFSTHPPLPPEPPPLRIRRVPYVFVQVADQDVRLVEESDVAFPPTESKRPGRGQNQSEVVLEEQNRWRVFRIRTGCEWRVKIQTVERGRVLCV